jgi:hypothetical protein
MPIQLIIRNPLDRDAREYIQRAGVSDAGGRSQINEFVRGIKSLGLWNSLVCWPLRSTQNAGTGTTAYSLGGLGTYNGTLVNGPTWGSDGITGNGTTQTITTAYTPPLLSASDVSCCAALTLAGKNNSSVIAGNRTIGFSFAGFWGVNLTAALAWAATGSSSQSSASTSAVLGTPFFYHGLVGTRSGATQLHTEVGINTNNRVTATTAGTASGSTKVVTLLEDGNGTNRLEGTAAWIALFNGTVTKAQSDNIFSLYKSTLGSGLGLP